MQRTIQTYYVPQMQQQSFVYRSPQRPIQQVQYLSNYQSPQRIVQYQGSVQIGKQQIIRQQSPIQQIIVQPQIHNQQSIRVLSPQPSNLYIHKQISPQVSLKNLIKESNDQQSTKKVVSPQPCIKQSYQPKFSNAVQEIKPSLDSRLSELDKKLQETLTKSFSITKYFKQKLDINKKIDFKLYNQDKKNTSINDLNIEEVKNEKIEDQ